MRATVSPRRNTSLIRGLQHFEAVARHLSVSLAAEELGVSQSAVSHQVRELTKVLGEQLLVRSGRGIVLSPTGQKLASKLATAFSNLHASVDDIVGSGQQVLRLAVCSSFAPGWLIPRLKGFVEANPGVDLQLQLYAEDPHLSHQVADAIVTALPVEPGYSAIHIVDEMLLAVQAPGHNKNQYRLITTDIGAAKLGLDWHSYSKLAGLKLADIQQRPFLQCTHYMLALEMARAGLGVALVPDFLARRDIESGTLAPFGTMPMPSGRVYNLCFKQTRSREPGIRSLFQWFKAELTMERA